MQFQGFTQETADFLQGLMFNNERPWFLEHKEQYTRALKEPFDALGRAALEEMERRHSGEDFRLHISRIYRDARRLYGKGPYKDHLWFTIWTGGGRHDNPAFWFQIGAFSYGYGVGYWAMRPEQMEEYRRYIDANTAAVERLARGILRQDRFVLEGEEYKRPKGDRGELLNPWYNRRWIGLECTRDFGGDALSPELPVILADGYDFLMPYYRFLCRFREKDE